MVLAASALSEEGRGGEWPDRGIDASSWAGLLLALSDQCREPHEPVRDCDAPRAIREFFASLPLYDELAVPEKVLRNRLFARGAKDRRLKSIILRLFAGARRVKLVNHCCVFSRHARELARRLEHAHVLAADIDRRWYLLYNAYERVLLRRRPMNFRFVAENVYHSRIEGRVEAMCVFGGCGSLVDASIDLGIRLESPYVLVRACCHENIGMNTAIATRGHTLWSLGHRVKNVAYRYYSERRGYYSDPGFGAAAYPRSRAGRALMTAEDVVRLARHAVDCWLCRTLIDVDRAHYLLESGYEIAGYSESMFVAVRRGEEGHPI